MSSSRRLGGILWCAIPLLAGCATPQTSPPQVPSAPSTATAAGETGAPDQTAAESSAEDADATAGEASAPDTSEAVAEPSGSSEADEPREAASTPSGEATDSGHRAAPPSGPRSAEDETTQLEADLKTSLDEFDGMLLREQEVIQKRRADSASAAAAASGSSGGGGGERSAGSAAESEVAETGGDQSGGGGAGASQPDGEPGRTDEDRPDRVPADVGDGSDDDIVARQLREAAMEEDDPELREKLWDEYRRYKAGQAGG